MSPQPHAFSLGNFFGTAFSGRYRWMMWSLLALMIVSPLIAHLPIVQGDRLGLFAGDIVTTSVFVVAIRTYHRHRGQYWFLMAIGTVSIVAGLAARVVEDPLSHALVLTSLAAAAVLLASIATLISLQVFATAEVDGDTICGSVSIYLLIAATFAAVYSLVAAIDPGAFTMSSQLRFDDPTLGPDRLLVYFSLATITTVGYGDVFPTSDITRPLSNLEAVIGQFYMTVLVARLVGQHLTRSMRSRETAG